MRMLSEKPTQDELQKVIMVTEQLSERLKQVVMVQNEISNGLVKDF